MNMFNFVHLMTFLTVVSLKMRCKDTTFSFIKEENQQKVSFIKEAFASFLLFD